MDKIHICFVNPPHPYLTQPKAQAPLGLLYVAASVREGGFPVSFVDLSDKRLDEKIELPKADIYGLTGTVLDIRACHRVAIYIRSKYPEAKIIIGGPASLSPIYIDETLIDSVVAGEGELEIFNVIADYPNLKQYYRAERVTNLDMLPFPARDLLGGNLGGDVFVDRKRHFEGGSTVISTSRGCPFDCTFCASPKIWGRKIIYRSAESVVQEVDHVIEKYGVRQLRFSDDNLTYNREELTKLCTHLRGKKIAWRASIRATPNDVVMFQMMKDAGCVEVCFGTESGDPDVLRTLRKKITVRENRDSIVNAKEAGLDVRVLMMIGTPGETVRTVDRTIEFIERVKDSIDTIAVTNFTPLPGCAIADEPEANHCEILDYDIDHYNLCLWGPEGRNEWANHIRPYALTLEQLTENKKRMVDYILSIGKTNRG